MLSFCENCEKSKKELEETKRGLKELQSIAKNIVQTDSLLRKFSDKEQQCEQLTKDLEKKSLELTQLVEQNKHITSENQSIKKQNKELVKEKAENERKLTELNEKLKVFHETAKSQEEQLRKKSDIEQNFRDDLRSRESRIDLLETENIRLSDELNKIKQEHSLLQTALEKSKQTSFEQQEPPQQHQQQTEKLKFSLSNSSDSNHEEPVAVKTVKEENLKRVEENKASKNLSFSLSFSDTETSSEDEEEVDEEEIKEKKEKPEEIKETPVISESTKEKQEEKVKEDVQVELGKEAEQEEEEEETLVPISEISLNTNEINIESIALDVNYESDNESVSSSTSSTSSNRSSSSTSFSSASSSSSSSSSRSSSRERKQKTDKIVKSDHTGPLDYGFSDMEDSTRESKNQTVQKHAESAVETEKIEQLVDAYMKREIEKLLVEVEEQTEIEMRICEFIRDKILTEEINHINTKTAQSFKSLAFKIIDEERQERKQQEKQFVKELKEKMEDELLNKILAENLNSLLRECCERVVQEARNERIQMIYEDILDEVIHKALRENILLEMVFDDMITPTKPLIEPIKYEFKPKESPIKTSQPVKRRLYQSEEPSTSLNQEFSASISNLSNQVKKSRLAEAGLSQSLHSPVASMQKSPMRTPAANVDQREMSEMHPKPQFIHHYQHKTGYIKLDYPAIKECIGEYFKKYNFKVGFTFDELNEIIAKLVNNLYKLQDLDPNSYAKTLSYILITHFLNNRFVPIDEQKLRQQQETEVNLLRNLLHVKKSAQPGVAKTVHASDHYIEFLQNKLNQTLNIKITNEEEKYVYLISKLKDFKFVENVLDDILNELKTALLSTDFNDFYNLRLARLISFLCKSNQKSDFLKCLIYDLIATKTSTVASKFHEIIILFIRVWSEPFVWPLNLSLLSNSLIELDFEMAPVKNPILCVIIFIVKTFIANKKTAEKGDPSDYFLHIVETLCNWVTSYKDANELINYFVENLALQSNLVQEGELFSHNEHDFNLTQCFFEYLNAIKLICAYQGWKWTSESFINNYLKPQLNEMLTNSQSNSVENKVKRKSSCLAAFYLLVQGQLIGGLCSKEDSVALETIRSYGLLLQNSKTDCLVVEFSTIEGLLLMAPFNPNEVFMHIQIWLMSFRTKKESGKQLFLPKSLGEKIKFAYDFYKDKLPPSIEIAI